MKDESPFIRVKIAAVRAGVSVKALCERAGVSHATVWRWGKGKATPNMGTYERLMAAAAEMAEANSK